MILDEVGRAAPRRGNAITAPPLADVACCREIPEAYGSIEPSAEPQLRACHVLDGRFLIREAISRSRMATTYRAEDMFHGRREVAAKVPLMWVESDSACLTRFLHEEEIGLKLSHPFLLRFYPTDREKYRPYIVTEFLRGCTLSHLGRGTNRLPEADSLKITSLICEALGYMHGQGLIHRDLKPANIMICCDQTLRVTDFELASPPVGRRSLLAKLAPVVGTPEYMAPEQVEKEPVDERTDIYGLGAILYELLTGSVPFQNANVWESAFQRTTGDPIAPRRLNPALSPQAEEIVLHALQRRPVDRYQSMTAFRADLCARERVRVTGYCERLQPPRWRLSLQATPVLSGLLLGLGAILLLVIGFLILSFRLAAR
jgi:serine/threonine-protein kinase